MQPISFEEFSKLATKGNVIPIAQSIVADLLTPVSAFLKLCPGNDDGFLFESVEGGERVARYSFLGCNPREYIEFDGRRIIVTTDETREETEGDIFNFLQSKLASYQFVNIPELPRFAGGLVGFFSYDTVRYIEKLPEKNEPLDSPLAGFGLYDTILAFDRLKHRILIITNVLLEEGADLKRSYDRAIRRIESYKQILQRPIELIEGTENAPSDIQSNFKPQHFREAVTKAQEHIQAGDIFQVVLSQQFSCDINVPPFYIYRALRQINPSPYLFYVRRKRQSIIGSSPELLVRVEDGEVAVRPIAGTRPRGADSIEDDRLAADLLADEKERAEHVMLVDLGRNDVGRVSAYGSVELVEKMKIERYSHVMHIVSEVRGKLRDGYDAIDAFKAGFPAGTVSGAPKVRAMEIIEELEPERRGLYSGAVGYLDFSGNLDTCIAIRTLEVRDGKAYFQAGAGIVADSVPEKEYEETIHKSNALRTAITMAENGLKG
ncbi:MAG: anthranilate synthase component I [Calditrichota bacterium]